jgi:hypothetical protein
MLSIGSGHCWSLFFFRVQEFDGASDLGIRPEAEGGGGRERKGNAPLEQDDLRQVR